MGRRVSVIALLLVMAGIRTPRSRAADAGPAELERKFTQNVRPFLAAYCIGCHSGSNPAAQFDLRAYPNMAAVVADYAHWNLVMEKLASGEMPPKVGKQSTAEARKDVIEWVQAMRTSEARNTRATRVWCWRAA